MAKRKKSQNSAEVLGMESRDAQDFFWKAKKTGLLLVRNSLELAYANEDLPPNECLLLGPCHCAPGKTQASLLTGLLSPLSRPRFWPIVSFQARALSSLCRLPAREKGHPNGRKPQSFLFSSAGESKVIFGPFQYKSDFFFFFLKALCLAGFRQGSGN